MSTIVRPPNKTLWALDEAIGEHDPALAGLMGQLVGQVKREFEAAQGRFDKPAQARMGELVLTVVEMQASVGRLALLHRMARANEYDRR